MPSRCPTALRTSYAMPGTDLAYCATFLGLCYAMSGTDFAYGASTDLAYGPSRVQPCRSTCAFFLSAVTRLSFAVGIWLLSFYADVDGQNASVRLTCAYEDGLPGTDVRVWWYQEWVPARR
eukprot:3862716-Rhodomonas_salina.1